MYRKYTPFISLSRRKRRAETLKIKTLINRERKIWGGLFYDECDHAAAIAGGKWCWSDIVFLGQDPAVFWNAEIITANVAFADAVEETAFNEAMFLLEEAGKQNAVLSDNNPGNIISHTLLHRPEQTYSVFNGLTFNEFIDKRTLEIARDTPPVVNCGYRILPGFASGIGLKMVVEANVLNQALIEAAIQDFLARGERSWVSDVPSPVRYAGQDYL